MLLLKLEGNINPSYIYIYLFSFSPLLSFPFSFVSIKKKKKKKKIIHRLSTMIRKTIDTPDWLETKEPRGVRPVLDMVFDEFKTIDHEVCDVCVCGICVCMYVCVCMCMCVCVYVYVFVYVYVCVCMCMCMCVCPMVDHFYSLDLSCFPRYR